jgi:hypothetical protein
MVQDLAWNISYSNAVGQFWSDFWYNHNPVKHSCSFLFSSVKHVIIAKILLTNTLMFGIVCGVLRIRTVTRYGPYLVRAQELTQVEPTPYKVH